MRTGKNIKSIFEEELISFYILDCGFLLRRIDYRIKRRTSDLFVIVELDNSLRRILIEARGL